MINQRSRIRLMFMTLLSVSIYSATAMAQISFVDLLNRPLPTATKRLAYGVQADQFGDLWLPEGPEKHPLIVMIHGGCWQSALPGVNLMAYIAEDMRKSGFAVWNIEYRRLGSQGAGYPGTFLDIAKGIDFLRTLDVAYNLDLSHVTIVGHSAGGQLALWAAARDHINSASNLYMSNPLAINFVVTLAGINDLKAYREKGAASCGGPDIIDQLINLQGRLNQDAYSDTSPASMLPLNVRQLIISGVLDPIVPYKFGNDYAALAKGKGDHVEVMDIQDAGHFELIDPTSNAWKIIKESLMAH